MPIYYEAKALERAIDATPVLPQTAKNLLKKIIRSAPVADEIEKLRKELDRVPAANVIEKPQWISVEDKLPDAETEVLAVCNRNGFRFVCPAIYEDGTVLTQDSMWSWYDLDNYETYSEENDDYFIPEGWWENRHFTPDDVYNSPVDCPVTYWMPLPAPPNNIEED